MSLNPVAAPSTAWVDRDVLEHSPYEDRTVPASVVAAFLTDNADASFIEDLPRFYHTLCLDDAEFSRIRAQYAMNFISLYEKMYKVLEEFVRKQGRLALVKLIHEALRHTNLLALQDKLSQTFNLDSRIVVPVDLERNNGTIPRGVPIHYHLPTRVSNFQFRVSETDAFFAAYKTFRQRPWATGIIAVTGEEGVGKATLVSNFCHLVRDIPIDGKRNSTVWLQCDSEFMLSLELKGLLKELNLDVPMQDTNFFSAALKQLHAFHCDIPILLVLENAAATSGVVYQVLQVLNGLPAPKPFVVVTSSDPLANFSDFNVPVFKLAPLPELDIVSDVLQSVRNSEEIGLRDMKASVATILIKLEKYDSNEMARTANPRYLVTFVLCFLVHVRRIPIGIPEDIFQKLCKKGNGINQLDSAVLFRNTLLNLCKMGLCKVHKVVFKPNVYGLRNPCFESYVEVHPTVRRQMVCEMPKSEKRLSNVFGQFTTGFDAHSKDTKDYILAHKDQILQNVSDSNHKKELGILFTTTAMKHMFIVWNYLMLGTSMVVFSLSIVLVVVSVVPINLPFGEVNDNSGSVKYWKLAFTILSTIVSVAIFRFVMRIVKPPLRYLTKYFTFYERRWLFLSCLLSVVLLFSMAALCYILIEFFRSFGNVLGYFAPVSVIFFCALPNCCYSRNLYRSQTEGRTLTPIEPSGSVEEDRNRIIVISNAINFS